MDIAEIADELAQSVEYMAACHYRWATGREPDPDRLAQAAREALREHADVVVTCADKVRRMPQLRPHARVLALPDTAKIAYAVAERLLHRR
jgi:hypothetical protein